MHPALWGISVRHASVNLLYINSRVYLATKTPVAWKGATPCRYCTVLVLIGYCTREFIAGQLRPFSLALDELHVHKTVFLDPVIKAKDVHI